MLRDIDPVKLREKRGSRTRQVIAEATKGVVSTQDIYCYEQGLHRPSLKKLPSLLEGLGATYEEVSSPVEVSV